MAIKVLIANDPYKRKFSILIDGQPISTYIALEKDMSRPFYDVCDTLLSDLSYELNGSEFDLDFQSRKIELDIMEQKFREYSANGVYTALPLEYDLPVNKRLALLSRLLKDDPAADVKYIRKRILVYYSGISDDVLSSLEDIRIENAFCKLEFELAPLSSYSSAMGAENTVFFLTDEAHFEKTVAKTENDSGFIILLGGTGAYLKQIGKRFCFRTTADDLVSCVFECLMFKPLEQVLCECVEALPADYRNAHTSDIDRIVSSAYRIWINLESSEIELGHSVQFDLETDKPDTTLRCSNFTFECKDPDIVTCNGMRIEGIGVGSTVVYVFRRGEIIPCAQTDVSVHKRNRITKINLLTEQIVLGEGDTEELDFDYYPVDADNTAKIEFRSENADIASVSSKGAICGKKAGFCRVWITAEQISAVCCVNVFPYAEDIVFESDEIRMNVGDTFPLQYSVVPEDSLDDQVSAAILNSGIAYIEDDIIHAFDPGTTELILENSSGRIRKTIPVIVEKTEEIAVPAPKKKGLLSRIFGRG